MRWILKFFVWKKVVTPTQNEKFQEAKNHVLNSLCDLVERYDNAKTRVHQRASTKEYLMQEIIGYLNSVSDRMFILVSLVYSFIFILVVPYRSVAVNNRVILVVNKKLHFSRCVEIR